MDFASLRLCVRKDGRVALCLLCVSVPLWLFEHRAHTQKASAKKQKPKSKSPNASPTNSKKPRVFISKGCDMSLSPFLRNFGFFVHPIRDFSCFVWEDGAKSRFAQCENGERLAEISEADALAE